ncbi:MAG: bifunctional 4-hydroxy-3-methylbut-2-enyl diphosphate reductase/30S ribosomal protein S1 [Clostridiales bacterium]|jgi:4-hydroxy-3-methylbut-2-enyl diphosphate reductase|nr:bifunctional 4-hydroxy-3-methylbut-2-enyl diphosphate reductase/30S ribosomal protein S1 [Clostridiales bacterium]
MKLHIAKNGGFCFGVKKAVETAFDNAGPDTYTYGPIIHNPLVTERLEALGVKNISDLAAVNAGKIIIRSHGVKERVIREIEAKGLTLIDATCPFVKKIHAIVSEYDARGYHILIAGDPGHPEVVGIGGWCGDRADTVDETTDPKRFDCFDKLCLVAQTTFSPAKYAEIAKNFGVRRSKTVEIFDTICYTTISRQSEAEGLSKVCDVVLVVGSRTSANTTKLYSLASSICKRAHFVERIDDLADIAFCPDDAVGIIAGASTPDELTMEVRKYMSQNFETEVASEEFKKGVEESLVSYKVGRRVKGTVISADEKGIKLNIGGKQDGFIKKEDVAAEGEYNPEDFAEGTEIEVKIISGKKDEETGCILLSKKEIDLIRESDKIVETIRNGEYFDIPIEKNVTGGLLSRLGNYTVFIPASHVQERFVKDLKPFVGKTLTVTALEIDDNKRKIVASHKKVSEAERKDREEIFWTHIVPNVVVSGVVKRVTNFGAFVSVDGVDCLAHIVDLSWSHIKTVDEVLTVGETYEFLVLSADREKSRVSLGYKQLQAHPFINCMEKHPVGAVVRGKVVSIVPFGVFVEIEPHIEGLVHVSEVAHNFIKNISEAVKVGDEVDVKILNYDEANRKINLSIKACAPEEAREEAPRHEGGERRGKKGGGGQAAKSMQSDNEWSEDSVNNPFADLLKNLDVTGEAQSVKKTEEPQKETSEPEAQAQESKENAGEEATE